MWRKVRHPLTVFLFLFVGLVSVTLRPVHQAQLNRDLLTALWDYHNDLLMDAGGFTLRSSSSRRGSCSFSLTTRNLNSASKQTQLGYVIGAVFPC